MSSGECDVFLCHVPTGPGTEVAFRNGLWRGFRVSPDDSQRLETVQMEVLAQVTSFREERNQAIHSPAVKRWRWGTFHHVSVALVPVEECDAFCGGSQHGIGRRC